jgi:guanylate kinase
MIYIVIGQSGSGKTTFCKEKIIKPPFETRKDKTKLTECGNGIVAIGEYGIGRRCEGTDTLPYNAQESIIEQVKELVEAGKDVLIEGDRITSNSVMEKIKSINTQKKMYLVICSLKTSMERLKRAGSKITPTFVKTTKTKSKRIYMEYSREFDGEIINTEEL